MFDLFRSREKAVRILLTCLLGLVALSMLTYLIPGGYSSGASGREDVVAEIGKEKITIKDVQMQLQSAIRNRSFPSEMVEFYAPQMINKMISERALAFEANRMGFKVSDAEMAEVIQTMLPQVMTDGKVDKVAYQGFLAQQNMTIPEFEANLRKQMLLTNMRNVVLEGIVVTPAELDQEFHRRNDKVKLEYIAFTPEKMKSQVTLNPQQLQAFFMASRANFTIPEKRSLVALVFDEAKTGAAININDTVLRSSYEANKDKFRTPERVRVRHILLKTTGKSKEESDKLKAKAEDLLKQLKSGADFAELAKKNSEDTQSAIKGGDLDWVQRGQMVKNFEDTAFSLKPKEISNVITTEYGFHIVQVTEREDAHLKTFDEAKDTLAAEMKRQQVFDRMQSAAEQARTELAKNPAAADQLAQQLNATVVRVEKVAPGDPLPEIGVNKDFEGAFVTVPKGGTTPVIQLAANKLAVAAVTDVQPSRPAEFAEVESKIREDFTNNQAQKLALDKANEAIAKLGPNGDLHAVAKSMGLEVKTTAEFNREGAAEGIGSADYVRDAFDKPVGAIVGPARTPENNVFVCKVLTKNVADPSLLATQRAELIQNLKRKKSTERNDLFEDGVLSRLIKEGKVKIHDDVIKQVTTSYRSS